jgi:hypothetical protein
MKRGLHSLKLGKGAAFDKRLRQKNDIWEADFRALPKPMTQNETHYLGMVVKKRGGSVLGEAKLEGRPSASDLATLLGKAMREPLAAGAQRPRSIHIRGHRQWQALVPHLEELGIKVSVTRELPKVSAAYKDRLRQIDEARRTKMARPTEEQAQVAKLFPAIAQWVQGDQESAGFVAMALGYGGVVYEDDRPRTLAEAMAVLETGLRKWMAEQGIEVG